MNAISPIRPRSRPTVGVQPVAPAQTPASSPPVSNSEAVSAHLRTLLADFWRLNTQANAMKNAADKAKKALNAAMLGAEVTEVSERVALDGGTVQSVRAEIAPKLGLEVDVQKLRGMVTDEVFWKIVGATKNDVEAFAGTNTYLACATEKVGPDVMTVKKV